jgi:hypothetical protein
MSFFNLLKNDIIDEPFKLETYRMNQAITNSSDIVSLCNNINYQLLYNEIESLDLTEEQKDQLSDTIYTNCMDSGYNRDLADQFLLLNGENNNDN